MSLFGRFAPLIRLSKPHRGKLTASVILGLISAVLALIPFLLVAEIGSMLMKSDQASFNSNLLTLVLIAFAALVLRYLTFAASVILSHLVAFMTMYDLQKLLTKKIGQMHLGTIDQYGSSRLKQIITQDTDIAHVIIGHYVQDFVNGTVVPFITVIAFFAMDWRLGLAAVALLPFLYWAHKGVFKNFDEEATAYAKASERFQSDLIEFLQSIKVIKVYNRDLSQKLRHDAKEHTDKMLNWTDKTTKPWGAFNVLTDANLFFVLPVGLLMMSQGLIGAEVLIFFMLLGIGYLQPLVRLSTQLGFLSKAQKSLQRIEDVLDAPSLPVSENPKCPRSYGIELKNVSFSYTDHNKAIDKISAKIPEGQLCAIVGPSGAGKSTMAQLVGRFWDVDEGSITIGDVDLRDIKATELYEAVSFVFQDVFLFRGTIKDNLLMACSEASDERIVRACKFARAHDFIMEMGGYDTMVGDQGANLSGGQKQRLSIARAILRDAPILILDEATAYADPLNEYEIQQGLAALMEGRTTIMIAHRLSTIKHADQIIVLEDGQLEDTGTHDELLGRGGLYAHLWSSYTQSDELDQSKDDLDQQMRQVAV